MLALYYWTRCPECGGFFTGKHKPRTKWTRLCGACLRWHI